MIGAHKHKYGTLIEAMKNDVLKRHGMYYSNGKTNKGLSTTAIEVNKMMELSSQW